MGRGGGGGVGERGRGGVAWGGGGSLRRLSARGAKLGAESWGGSLSSPSKGMNSSSLVYLGLACGLGWVGLGWVGLGWVGLGWGGVCRGGGARPWLWPRREGHNPWQPSDVVGGVRPPPPTNHTPSWTGVPWGAPGYAPPNSSPKIVTVTTSSGRNSPLSSPSPSPSLGLPASAHTRPCTRLANGSSRVGSFALRNPKKSSRSGSTPDRFAYETERWASSSAHPGGLGGEQCTVVGVPP